MKTTPVQIFTTVILMFTFSHLSFASDHIDGPVTMEHGVADITDLYAFPTPNKKGRLSLVLNVYPMVPADGPFSEKVNYVFLLRKAEVDKSFEQIATNEESKIICSFKIPYHKSYSANCQTDRGLSAKSKFDQKFSKGDFRLFAGMVRSKFYKLIMGGI